MNKKLNGLMQKPPFTDCERGLFVARAPAQL